jgi:hypothetical protein
MGFGTTKDEMTRLLAVAGATAGNLEDAIDMLEEDREASEQLGYVSDVATNGSARSGTGDLSQHWLIFGNPVVLGEPAIEGLPRWGIYLKQAVNSHAHQDSLATSRRPICDVLCGVLVLTLCVWCGRVVTFH